MGKRGKNSIWQVKVVGNNITGNARIFQAGVADWSANHFQTLTSPVPSPVKKILGPPCIDRISCFANIFPLSINLKYAIEQFIQVKEVNDSDNVFVNRKLDGNFDDLIYA